MVSPSIIIFFHTGMLSIHSDRKLEGGVLGGWCVKSSSCGDGVMGRFGTWRPVDMMSVVRGYLPNGVGGQDGLFEFLGTNTLRGRWCNAS